MTAAELIEHLKNSPADAEVWFDEKHTNLSVDSVRNGFVIDCNDGYGDVFVDEEDLATEEYDDVRDLARPAVILDE
jgi:hypothetical protein